ncbi:MAG: helix-turn-helix domain-containing protein [Ignavibacteriae bacterium]|nr:helix-turn-helix domain-containing protein [Ignavibacteria bacterium]MBI3365074.1 helix-turn-helix domain-containing protein [Ignavibacteriota bacterium]
MTEEIECHRWSIHFRRRKQGLSREELSKQLRIDPTTLARWERGEIEPRGKLKEHLNSFLKILTG